MKEKEIKKKYKELINQINNAKIHDGRGTYDAYVCNNCQSQTITIYTDLGVTPFCIKCHICGKTMTHKHTLKDRPMGVSIKEWIRPSLEQALEMNDLQLEHLFNGGLFLKEELEEPVDQKKQNKIPQKNTSSFEELFHNIGIQKPIRTLDDLKSYISNGEAFQTPPEVCEYMCSMIPKEAFSIFEPTPGKGNILNALNKIDRPLFIQSPVNFFDINNNFRYDTIVMNPPFSSKYAFGVPDNVKEKGMRLGYYILTECMKMSDHVIALMPWFTISDSDVRLRFLKEYGLKSITALPRKTFKYARIQTCIFELEKGFNGETIFKTFNF